MFVVVDVGCIECGEATVVLAVFPGYEAALAFMQQYCDSKVKDGKAEIDRPPCRQVMAPKNLLMSFEYFDWAQHHVELHQVPVPEEEKR